MFLLTRAWKPFSESKIMYKASQRPCLKNGIESFDAVLNQKKVATENTSVPEPMILISRNSQEVRQETCGQNGEDTEMGEPEAEVSQKDVEDSIVSVNNNKHTEVTETNINKHVEDTEMTSGELDSTVGKDLHPIIEHAEEEGKPSENIESATTKDDINPIREHVEEEGKTTENVDSLNKDDLHPVAEHPKEEGNASEKVDSVSKGNQRPLPHRVEGSITLSEVWKEDAALGPLLASLVELFGDAILPFVPNHELSFFI